MGGRTIPQPLYTTQRQGKGPGTIPLALPSEWTHESAAASLGIAWKLGMSLLSTRAAPLPLGGVGLTMSICSHPSAKWWWKLWMASICYRPKGLQDMRKRYSTWSFMLVAISFWLPWVWFCEILSNGTWMQQGIWHIHTSKLCVSGLQSCLRHLPVVFCLVLSTSWGWAFQVNPHVWHASLRHLVAQI